MMELKCFFPISSMLKLRECPTPSPFISLAQAKFAEVEHSALWIDKTGTRSISSCSIPLPTPNPKARKRRETLVVGLGLGRGPKLGNVSISKSLTWLYVISVLNSSDMQLFSIICFFLRNAVVLAMKVQRGIFIFIAYLWNIGHSR